VPSSDRKQDFSGIHCRWVRTVSWRRSAVRAERVGARVQAGNYATPDLYVRSHLEMGAGIWLMASCHRHRAERRREWRWHSIRTGEKRRQLHLQHPGQFNYTNGFDPAGGLVLDAAGNLFGTTYSGGAYDQGTVFEIPKTSIGYASVPARSAAVDQRRPARRKSALGASPGHS
jgi:uncharacterized repeat protein (TIGR03803 family)